jgi:diadenosine tetraphosphatase ApaH/serine/threonine PP2A family protein phosphatase
MECLEHVQSLGCRTVAGNHDFAALGKIEIDYFNVYAKEATLWTRDNLTEDGRNYLMSLPLVEHLDGFSIVHGTLYSPELFDYIQTSYDAYLSISKLPGEVCFIGHSHIPVAFIKKKVITYSLENEVDVEAGGKVMINVGSVGQPRDSNPRASFAIFDTEARKVWIRRIAYDVEASIAHIREAQLPEILGERLKFGR